MGSPDYKRPPVMLVMFFAVILLILAIPTNQISRDAVNTEDAELFDYTEATSGYAGDPVHGNEPSTIQQEITVISGTTNLDFKLDWTNDDPNSDPPEFSLMVNGVSDGIAVERTDNGIVSPLTISMDGEKMGGDWTVEISLLDAGRKPMGLGIIPALSEPKEGNSWELRVDISGSTILDPLAAPDFSLVDIEGNIFRLRDHPGKVVVIDLNSISCPKCAEQIEELIPIHQRYGESIAVITVVTAEVSDSDIKDFRDSIGAEWTFARDNDGVVEKYQLTSTRKLVIIDTGGRAVYSSSSVVSEKKLVSEIESAVQGNSSPLTFGSIGILGLAFIIGMSTFFAPCGLPLLPAYASRLHLGEFKDDGQDEVPANSKRRAISIASCLSLGSGMFYVAFGGVVGLLGAAASRFLPAFGIFMAIVLVVLGVLIALDRPPMLSVAVYRLRKMLGLHERRNPEYVNSYIRVSKSVGEGNTEYIYMGLGYGAASSACHGIMFVSVILIASSSGILMGLKAGLVYAMGLALIMFTAFALVSTFSSTIFSRMQKHMATINRFSGFLLVVAGSIILYYTL